MTRPVRLPTVQSAHANHEQRIYDLERKTRSSQTDTRPDPSVYLEVAPFSQYGTVTLTAAADSAAWVVGTLSGKGGLVNSATLSLSTAGSTSTVVTIYVNGNSIGTVTYASGDTTPQTDALTATRCAVGAKITARVTTAGTGAAGLSCFVPIRP